MKGSLWQLKKQQFSWDTYYNLLDFFIFSIEACNYNIYNNCVQYNMSQVEIKVTIMDLDYLICILECSQTSVKYI